LANISLGGCVSKYAWHSPAVPQLC